MPPRPRPPVPGTERGEANGGDESWLLLVRTDGKPASTPIQKLAKAGRFERATRYELDRVLMHEPRSVPRYLTVFELTGNSNAEVMSDAEAIQTAQPGSDHGFYRLIRDEARP